MTYYFCPGNSESNNAPFRIRYTYKNHTETSLSKHAINLKEILKFKYDTIPSVTTLRVISIRKAVSNNDAEILYNLPFVLAWIGCDSVSAIFRQGKHKVIKYFINSAEFKNICCV